MAFLLNFSPQCYFSIVKLTSIYLVFLSKSCRHLDCGGRILSRTGVIESPRYPNAYPPNKDCEWVLQTTPHYRLELSFAQFSLPARGISGCSDYVQVRNGTSALSPLIGTYCSRAPALPIKSMSNTMFVKFHSDSSSNAYVGFNAAFNAGKLHLLESSVISYDKITKITFCVSIIAKYVRSLSFDLARISIHHYCVAFPHV